MKNGISILFTVFFLIASHAFSFEIVTTSKSKLESLKNTDLLKLLTVDKSNPKYLAMVARIKKDILDRKRHENFKVYETQTFDSDWLTDKRSKFELSAVSFRLDRREFTPEFECGQVRLLYRLRYDSSKYGTDQGLPMTAMLVFPVAVEKSECKKYVQNKKILLAKIADGSLKPAALEVNLLSLRILAPYKPDTAGYSEYLLRVFDSQSLKPIHLDNTPNEKMTTKRKAELKQWIETNRTQIRSGEFMLPKKFLTKRAFSIAPGGSYRKGNMPFTRILGDELAEDVLLYLNRSSCQGCHQKGSMSGFHILGADSEDQHFYNSIKDPVSPNVAVQVEFRNQYERHYLLDLKAPKRPLPGRHQQSAKVSELGGACEKGHWKSNAENPFLDIIEKKSQVPCSGNTLCMPSEIGFPGGYCIGMCEDDSESCHPVPALMQFTECLETKTRDECMRVATSKVLLKSCTLNSECRNDYICTETKNKKRGVCAPPYFLQQLNLHGHI